jgi:DNA-binding winged helix-turn-helix (wHTH) protein
MPDQVGTSEVIRFATFEIDLQAQGLRKGGVRLKLTGQPFQALAILLESPGAVVTREELQKRLWPDTFVDVDHNLNTAINKIREALNDSVDTPRFVETLPRRVYRFVATLDNANPSSKRLQTSIPIPPLKASRVSSESGCRVNFKNGLNLSIRARLHLHELRSRQGRWSAQNALR